VGTRESGEDEEKEKHDLEPVPSFTKVYNAYETVTSVFYMHSISEHDKQNILNLELSLLHLKHMASTKELSKTTLGKVACKQVLTSLFTCLTFP
jgi:hypothetical protein